MILIQKFHRNYFKETYLQKMKWIIPILGLIFFVFSCAEDNTEIIPEADFNISSTSIFFNSNEDMQQIEINNYGSGKIKWSVAITSGDFVNLRNSQGEIGAESNGSIIIDVDRQNLGEGVYQSELVLMVASETYTITVDVSTIPSMSLDFSVIDADYSGHLNAIIAIDNTSQLYLIDPKNQFVQTLDLEFPSNCLALSPDGTKALIGHNYAYSIVDLIDFEVERVNGLLIEVFDAVYANDEWIYLFPAEDQWVSIHGYNVLTGEELTSFDNIYEKTIVKKHPSENYIYGISINSIPKDIEKYGFGNRPERLSETPYHGDYPIGVDLWVNGEENYILTQAGTIFNLSESPVEDLTYLSSLSLSNSYIQAANFNHSRNENYLLVSSNNFQESSDLMIYSDEWDLIDQVSFPPVEYDHQLTSEFRGQFVFFNTLGDQYYVLGFVPENDSKAAIINYQLK